MGVFGKTNCSDSGIRNHNHGNLRIFSVSPHQPVSMGLLDVGRHISPGLVFM